MPTPEPPVTARGEQAMVVTISALQGAAIHAILSKTGASAARQITPRRAWHKTTEADLELHLFYPGQGWDDVNVYCVRASGAWSPNGGQHWYDPVPA